MVVGLNFLLCFLPNTAGHHHLPKPRTSETELTLMQIKRSPSTKTDACLQLDNQKVGQGYNATPNRNLKKQVTAVIRPYENPRALQGRTVFNRYLGIGRSNRKISKSKVVVFFNFASGRTLSTQSTGPQPIQLVPK